MRRKLAYTGGRTMLTEFQVRGIRKAYRRGNTVTYIAKVYNLRWLVVDNVVKGKTYKGVR